MFLSDYLGIWPSFHSLLSVFWATLSHALDLSIEMAQIRSNRSTGKTLNLIEHMQLRSSRYTHKCAEGWQNIQKIERKHLLCQKRITQLFTGAKTSEITRACRELQPRGGIIWFPTVSKAIRIASDLLGTFLQLRKSQFCILANLMDVEWIASVWPSSLIDYQLLRLQISNPKMKYTNTKHEILNRKVEG